MNATSRTGSISLCVVGATGRMGKAIIEAAREGFIITGAVTSGDNPNVGRTLRQLGLAPNDVKLSPSVLLADAAVHSDVVISFTTPSAELSNAPLLAALGKPVVIGTTGYSPSEEASLRRSLEGVAAVISPNFSIGANYLYALTKLLATLPDTFDFSIVEEHHAGKADAPSGTAKAIASIILQRRKYTKLVSGRSGASKRQKDELELFSIRAGGIPGRHEVLAASSGETIRLEHEAFSREAFASGALVAAKWVLGRNPGVYSMAEVLGLN
jgi:4-hydroxy-tetrahydrodipicolinate reductase